MWGQADASFVSVSLYDGTSLVGSSLITTIATASQEIVTVPYVVPAPLHVHRILRAEASIVTPEQNSHNNAATKIVAVGNPTGTVSLAVSNLDIPSPLYFQQHRSNCGRYAIHR